jgi:hypothetical protein
VHPSCFTGRTLIQKKKEGRNKGRREGGKEGKERRERKKEKKRRKKEKKKEEGIQCPTPHTCRRLRGSFGGDLRWKEGQCSFA